jgi:DNA-binding MarR family transcriptional regulator
LESAGLVTRSRGAEDERQVHVELTAVGRRLRVKAKRVPSAVIERLGLPLAELEDLRKALNRVNAAARRALDECRRSSDPCDSNG